MPRDLPIGNGKVLVNFDKQYRLRDIYFPHVGQENQTIGHVSQFGVWVDGQFAWVGDGWNIQRNYCVESLVTDVTLHHDQLQLDIRMHDTVDFEHNIFVREAHVTDTSGKARQVRLFFHQDFHISENDIGDTAFYDPRSESVIHYKKNRWFLVNVCGTHLLGVNAWSIGNKEVNGNEGTFRDAEDGNLGCNPIAQGSVDSTIQLTLDLQPRGTEIGHFWMCFGQTYEEVIELDNRVRNKRPESFISRNQNYWRLWVNPEYVDYLNLPTKVVDLFKRSLLVIRTQVDDGGAIIAANDHDIAAFARDTYSYMWPRDGALVANALSRAGYFGQCYKFFAFCSDVIKPEGYLLHKYNPDKSLASSWHPWVQNGKIELPIQEDETALVIWSLWQHFRRNRDVEIIKPFYSALVSHGAEFLVRYRDEVTNLPNPSYDLWEERYGVHLFTVASVIGGLTAAAHFAHALGELEQHRRWQEAAEEVQAAMIKHMWSEKDNRFCRMATRTADGYSLDMTVDASMYAIFAFAGMPTSDAKVKATMKAIKDRLWVKTDVGGCARYEDDYYHQVTKDIANVPGNPWFICTMWLAQYEIASAHSQEHLREAVKLLEWVADRALPSGVLAEQVHPYTNEPLSVSPLTWSHATLVTCVLEYLEKRRKLMAENVFAHTISPM